MGDIAEMMINGDLDFETGEYIGPGQGYPRTHNHKKFNKRNDWTHAAERGVIKWLTNNGFGDKHQQSKVIKLYNKEQLNISNSDNMSNKSLSLNISEDFNSFRKWIKQNYTELYKQTM